jgi:hypothetical protein
VRPWRELRAEEDRVLAELSVAEAVLERRVIVRLEQAEALAAGDDAACPPRLEVQVPPPSAHVDKVPSRGDGGAAPGGDDGSDARGGVPADR